MNSETREQTSRKNGAKGGRPRERGAGRVRILELLRDRQGVGEGWVSLQEILRLGVAQYNARILELRREGKRIECREEWRAHRKFTWYRLLA